MKQLSLILTAMIGLFFTQTVVAQYDNELPAIKTDTAIAMFSKEKIEEKLERLAVAPPSNRFHSYMCRCYPTIQYICPKCGDKILYEYPKIEWLMSLGIDKFTWNRNGYFELVTFDDKTYNIVSKMEECRCKIKEIKGIHVTLNESGFCNHCSSPIEKPTYFLVINISGKSDTTTTSNVSVNDIELLQAFLDSDIVRLDNYYDGTPLMKSTDFFAKKKRIKELLGIK